MARVTVELSWEQLLAAIRGLSPQEKLALWRALDHQIDRGALRKRFDEAVAAIRTAHPGVKEDEVLADVAEAVREVRAAHRSSSGS